MIEHEINMEMDNGKVVHSLYIDGILIDKYPRVVPEDFYDVIQRKLLMFEIAHQMHQIQKKYC
jgi:hypothetical protein